jgi:5-methylcytosine-specific restriction enzyme subunit McrC
METLFEYGKWEPVKRKAELQKSVKDIWSNRKINFNQEDFDEELSEDEIDQRYQPFLKFDGDEIRANNYVGFIQHGEEIIEIYPKVFREYLDNPNENDKRLMLRHIFYWFDYCRKWKFPFNKASLDTFSVNSFPELIIKLIADQFLAGVSNQPLTMYNPIEEALTTPRGTINFKRYINNSLSSGNYQNVECDYEQFMFDNKVNRAIKYCTRVLLNQTKIPENVRLLQEVLFILDEVEDIPCTRHDLECIVLNSFFENYIQIIDSCKLIISQELYSNNSFELSQWCLLFPMEYIFEDFLAGFLEDRFSDNWVVKYQKSDKDLASYDLSNPKAGVFNMQHDIFLTSKPDEKRKIIIDAKYKVRSQDFKTDKKKGVDQKDLYQMVSYAYRRGCTEIFLIYPNITEDINEPDYFYIQSEFNNQDVIKVTTFEIPFWSLENFSPESLAKRLFDVLEKRLSTQ